MSLDVNALTDAMATAGKGLAGGVWEKLKTYALPELKKISLQIVAIAENITDYTPEGAKALLNMQINATVGVFVAMTTLTLIEVQAALNAMLDAIRATVNGALKFPLI